MPLPIRASITGKYEQLKLNSMLDDLDSRFNRVKRESLREFFERVRESAIENIEEHGQETNVPQTGNLADSIVYDIPRPNRGRMSVGGPGVPYAAIHEEGNQGGKTLILPTHGKYLVFFNHRTGEFNKRRFVMMPSYQYFSRAWTSHIDEFPDIMREKLDEYF